MRGVKRFLVEVKLVDKLAPRVFEFRVAGLKWAD